MQNSLVNLNGEILPALEAKVSVYDRSYLYGDSLYEVARSYHGKFFKLEDHLIRMESSAKLCRMALSQSRQEFQKQIQATFASFRKLNGPKAEAYCRIVVSRGTGRIGFALSNLSSASQYAILMQPVDEFVPTPEKFERGMSFQIAERLRNDRRALDPAMKSGNYLNSLLAYLEATSEGFDDALLCNSEGHLTEGTTFNIFYVRNGIIATPPLDVGILDGITRRHVIEIATRLGIPVREVRFPAERMYEANEVFMTSSLKEVFPVTSVDGRRIDDGKPGPITRRLAEAYRKSTESLS